MNIFGKELFRASICVVALMVSVFGLMICSSLQSRAVQADKHVLLAASKKEKSSISNPVVVLETDRGTIKIKVLKAEAPITADNFLDLVHRGFYNNLSFHRYEPGFVIQGGDPTGTGRGNFIDPETHKSRTIPLEVKSDLRHDAAGVVAMARGGDPNSASCQFYITLGPASFLDGKYAVFGRVIDGMSVVQQLRPDDKMTKVFELDSSK